MSLTRRLFLRNTAAAGAVVATASTPAIAETDPIEAIHDHLRELTKAMQRIHPSVDRYTFDAELGLAMVSVGLRRGTLVDGTYHDVDRATPTEPRLEMSYSAKIGDVE